MLKTLNSLNSQNAQNVRACKFLNMLKCVLKWNHLINYHRSKIMMLSVNMFRLDQNNKMMKYSKTWANGRRNVDDKAIPWTASTSERWKINMVQTWFRLPTLIKLHAKHWNLQFVIYQFPENDINLKLSYPCTKCTTENFEFMSQFKCFLIV